MTPSRDIARLIEIMAALRHPETGCSWDLAQSFASVAPYAVEEAYEVADAVERGDREDLREELGDLLLQVVFQARIAEEEGSFDFGGVVEAITAKLVRRHPHIFGDRRDLTPAEVKAAWGRIKAEEKAERECRAGPGQGAPGLLSRVGTGIAPLPRAVKLQRVAGTVGFDWNDTRAVLEKIREEADEVEAALGDRTAVADEIGDLLFAVANLARHAGVDPEVALHGANRKFERRFGHIERSLASRGSSLQEADLDAMEALWTEAKALERQA
ncbi:nucleoside triphosphate pyrophosphohydrolase [Lichenibacterium dinghuense]|uniref:nucleoside triphosphate pyrophosphohydrolase n=1 Tax=Lichenibacterium dinghuense TaxID=2895977 RepID=UPI001F190382|nr:nucleoside triphosphate pyrophosphohydrolase [Lichenibacterium sp. 6Y81]